MSGSSLADVAPKGAFARKPSVFRNVISKDGPHPPATGRYVLYVSYACPWACRCLAVRALKGLESAISVVVVDAIWGRTKPDVDDHSGWMIKEGADHVFGARSARAVYDAATPADQVPTERFTVPILLDSLSKTIVNNESSEIIRFFNSEFNEWAKFPEVDLYPAEHAAAIDAMNDSIYNTINNGVYRCGFAQSQEAYSEAIAQLFGRLDELDVLLQKQRFLVAGSKVPTESDVRLFVTLVRFDEVYVVHFKTNRQFIREYASLNNWMRDVYQWNNGALKPTVHMDHIKEHYYGSHKTLNPYGIIPLGPNTLADLEKPHNRAAL